MEDFVGKVRVLVLGDVERSPRTLRHAESFAAVGWEVRLSGHVATESARFKVPNIFIEKIKSAPKYIERRTNFKIFLMTKVLLNAIYLFFHLLCGEWTHILLIQNPPAVPTFFIAWMTSKIRGIKLIIDWHNYGHTLMSAKSGEEDFFARLYKYIELKFSKKLKAFNFCVSKALKNDLLLKWEIPSTVLYDFPVAITADRNVSAYHNLFLKLSSEYPHLLDSTDTSKTIFTEVLSDGSYIFRDNRPAIIISSCSWTIDDDFDTLFKALDLYNREISSDENLPEVVCFITGKGPMKSYFERMVSEQEWPHVTVIMPWLDIEDYPVLLSSADIGICLHKSTSGLDLPMKVVDMFAVGLPVLALNYKCLHELVIDRVNGRLFSSTDGLFKHLQELLTSFNKKIFCNTDIETYRDNIINKSRHELWQEEWEKIVLPIAEDLANKSYKNLKKTC